MMQSEFRKSVAGWCEVLRRHGCILAVSVVASVGVVGCTDSTSEIACANATCPPGTFLALEATSEQGCSGDVGLSLTTGIDDVSARCFASGSCVYTCEPPNKCCGNEAWTETSYSCETPCCADGNPPPCETACGNGVCEPGENPTSCAEDCVQGGVFQVEPTILSFGAVGNDLPLSLINKGSSSVSWELSAKDSWLGVAPTSGSVGSTPVVATVQVDRDGLAVGNHSSSVQVTTDAGYSRTIQVWVSVSDPTQPAEPPCVPQCSPGYFCLGGECVSECNPVCPANSVCVAGECHSTTTGTDCVDSCPGSGSTVCVSSMTYSVCGEESGCLAWSSSSSCPAGTLCTSGSCEEPENCQPTCTVSGAKECTSADAYKVCLLVAGCPVWSEAYSCGANSACQGGLCVNLAADVTLIQPEDGSSTSDASPFFDWADVSGADLYHFQLDASPSFPDPLEDQRLDSSLTPASSLSAGTHYWRVRAATGASWGEWSDTWSFQVVD